MLVVKSDPATCRRLDCRDDRKHFGQRPTWIMCDQQQGRLERVMIGGENTLVSSNFNTLPYEMWPNCRNGSLPAGSPCCSSFLNEAYGCQEQEGHYGQACVVIEATNFSASAHALLGEDVAKDKSEIRNHSAHKACKIIKQALGNSVCAFMRLHTRGSPPILKFSSVAAAKLQPKMMGTKDK